MAHKRFTVLVGARGRVVLPAELRRCLDLVRGDVLALDYDDTEQTVQLQTAADVARSARGLLRDLAPGEDLTADLLADRRHEAERENEANELAAER